MRTAALAIGVLLLAANAKSGEMGCDRAFVAQSWDLLKLAAYGNSAYERAAFVVRDPDGTERFAFWPHLHQLSEATYAGAVPPNTVAIIHTHPNSAPLPSDQDSQVARHLRMPVYVVTRASISRTTGHSVEFVWEGDWNPGRVPAVAWSLCRATSIAQVK